jgi:predicted RNA-binding protein
MLEMMSRCLGMIGEENFWMWNLEKKLVKKRIKHELTTLHLEWNGVERDNKKVVEKIKCMIHAKSLMEAL